MLTLQGLKRDIEKYFNISFVLINKFKAEPSDVASLAGWGTSP